MSSAIQDPIHKGAVLSKRNFYDNDERILMMRICHDKDVTVLRPTVSMGIPIGLLKTSP